MSTHSVSKTELRKSLKGQCLSDAEGRIWKVVIGDRAMAEASTAAHQVVMLVLVSGETADTLPRDATEAQIREAIEAQNRA